MDANKILRYQDTWEAFSDVFDELEEAKVVPKIR